MNRRLFLGLVAQVSGAFAVAFAGGSANAGNEDFKREPASNYRNAYGYYGGYGSYGLYGLYGGYGEYGSYGTYGSYGCYGGYGAFGAYGPYGAYGVYGYGPYYGVPLERGPGSVPSKSPKKKRGQTQGLNIDFGALTNRKA